jgi:hypothetical protein
MGSSVVTWNAFAPEQWMNGCGLAPTAARSSEEPAAVPHGALEAPARA